MSACGRSSREGPGPGPSPTASDAAPAAGRTNQALSETGSAQVTWKGTYQSAAGTLYVPPEWRNVHFSDSDGGAGLGEGPISLTVEGATGRVTGSIDGPLGPATVAGLLAEGHLTGAISRRDATDRGFTGTLFATATGDRLEGTMNMSRAEANFIRTAKFSLSSRQNPE